MFPFEPWVAVDVTTLANLLISLHNGPPGLVKTVRIILRAQQHKWQGQGTENSLRGGRANC